MKEKNDVIELKFIVDTKTGAKITGIPAKKMGLERTDYEILDKKNLTNEQGFKIFMFHTGIEEFTSPNIPVEYTTPLSNFPRGFNYYGNDGTGGISTSAYIQRFNPLRYTEYD